MNWLRRGPLPGFDTATTGADPEIDRIVQAGLVDAEADRRRRLARLEHELNKLPARTARRMAGEADQ
jgi:uncharacterized protein YlaN (UPF0358 family)